MSYVTSPDVFEKMGDRWNARREQEQKPASPIVRYVRGPNGAWNEIELEWEIEGYGPDGNPTEAPVRPQWVNPAPVKVSQRDRLFLEMRNENAPKYRQPEYRPVREDTVIGKSKPLTEEQLLRRKRQQAAVKARLTRRANELKASKARAWDILKSL